MIKKFKEYKLNEKVYKLLCKKDNIDELTGMVAIDNTASLISHLKVGFEIQKKMINIDLFII